MRDTGVEAADPSSPAPSRVTCVVLAAGASTRMGRRNKLLQLVDSVPMVVAVVQTALASRVDEVLVVTGEHRDRVEACLSGLPVRLVWNPDHAQGISTSLRVGASALPSRTQACVVCLGDMPLVRPDHIDTLIGAFHTHRNDSDARHLNPGMIFVPTWQGQRGNPVLWTVDLLPEVATLTADAGARVLIARHPGKVREVPVHAPGILDDVDTPEALQELIALSDTP